MKKPLNFARRVKLLLVALPIVRAPVQRSTVLRVRGVYHSEKRRAQASRACRGRHTVEE